MIRISKTPEVERKLQKAGKIIDLDSPKDIAVMVKMNEENRKNRRTFRTKERASWEIAKKTLLC